MKFGTMELYVLQEGTMRVDGGAVFGPIPRVRWERRFAPDKDNRVALGIRQILVKGPRFNLLIDCGFGQKQDDRTNFIYGITSETTLEQNLAQHGLKPEDITHVIFTHLHADHCGGSTRFNRDRSEVHPMFPKALHFIQNGEWKEAINPNEFSKVSYFFENFLPLSVDGKVRLLKGNQEIINGISVQVTGGHTQFHQMIKIEGDSRNFFFPGDLVPTSFHLPTSWRSAVDLFPMDLLESKMRFLDNVLNTNHIVAFSHEPSGQFMKVCGSKENPYVVPIVNEA